MDLVFKIKIEGEDAKKRKQPLGSVLEKRRLILLTDASFLF